LLEVIEWLKAVEKEVEQKILEQADRGLALEEELSSAKENIAQWEAQSLDAAVASVTYTLGILKNHEPGLDLSSLEKGFVCGAEADWDAIVQSISDGVGHSSTNTALTRGVRWLGGL
jgi:hypothetical protein